MKSTPRDETIQQISVVHMTLTGVHERTDTNMIQDLQISK